MAASIGFFLGAFCAAAGIGYLWLGFLWLVRVRKYWPRASIWSAILICALVGSVTAMSGNDPAITWLATGCAVAFMVYRARAHAKPAPSVAPPVQSAP